MENDEGLGKRKSVALDATLITDDQLRAEAEARNGLRQFDLGIEIATAAIANSKEGRAFRLRPSLILSLQRAALEGISSYAGNYRPADVRIEGSKHEPMAAHLVAEAVEEMCDYVNDHWADRSPIHLASYVMWRLNWIHPFADGNGRTSRILSYVILATRSGVIFPGSKTIPEQIESNRDPYFTALDAADAAFREGRIDLSEMEALIESLLAKQLMESFDRAKAI